MLRAGLRVGEVVSLKRADVLSPARSDQPARLRVCGKGRKERIVLLTADAYAVLNAWVQARPASDQPALFLNGQGQPLTTSGIEWLLHRYGAQIGVALTPHQLRHTFAAKSPKGGMPITSLGKLLGHADISTTQIYTAGADPELVHAYQTAMQQLARAPLPLVETPPPARPDEVARPLEPALPAAPPPVAPAMQPKVPPLPRWEDWRPDLPATLRQASLAFVQRRLPTWRPHRRREKAMHGLAEFSHFWDWQLAQRPIAQLAKLQLTDLRTYKIFRSAEGKAASTVNDTLDYVLALLRDHA